MTIRLYVLISLLLVVVGYTIGRYTTPEKVVTKTVIDTHTVTVVQHDIQTVTVTKPDGTSTTTVADHSVDTTKSQTDEHESKVVENQKPQWKVSAQFAPKVPQYEYFYGAQVERRILGPVFVGAFGNIDHTVGLSVGLEF